MRHKPRALKAIESLYEIYASFNRAYFGGALPSEVVILFVPKGKNGLGLVTGSELACTLQEKDKAQIIEVSEEILADSRLAKVVIAHEQIHVKGVMNHGPAFRREWDRLAKEGFMRELM